jgi:hypothetical protein
VIGVNWIVGFFLLSKQFDPFSRPFLAPLLDKILDWLSLFFSSFFFCWRSNLFIHLKGRNTAKKKKRKGGGEKGKEKREIWGKKGLKEELKIKEN